MIPSLRVLGLLGLHAFFQAAYERASLSTSGATNAACGMGAGVAAAQRAGKIQAREAELLPHPSSQRLAQLDVAPAVLQACGLRFASGSWPAADAGCLLLTACGQGPEGDCGANRFKPSKQGKAKKCKAQS